MKKIILILSLVFIFVGCSSYDLYSIGRAAVSQNPSVAFKALAKSKSLSYAANPSALTRDIKQFQKFMDAFSKSVSKEWGKDNVRLPEKKQYVKYLQNYKSRALIDFDKGIITVETLDEKNSLKSLHNAIVTTLLLPDDPRAADLFNAKKVKLGSTPYLLGEVKDDQGKNIRYSWRANRYANILTKKNVQTKSIEKSNKKVNVSYVKIPMVKDHASIRVMKFKPLVQTYAKRYNVSENLIYAIIRTESNFNQFAVSGAGALGLMQIVPTSAGRDAYAHISGKQWTPSKSYLFKASNNIKLGSAYIQILQEKYLKDIRNPISKEYCVISAYNTGSGNVFKAFNSNRNKAKHIINSTEPSVVYKQLRSSLPYEETRHYLKKVVTFKKDYIAL